MGLAASQARFLGITLRKANCEFKSTELAQQRLQLTNQMTDISQQYANALNATKLVWRNDAVCDSFGNPGDYGLSYSLLMMPSAANDYNPYMFSTRSGAIVLNAKYADAAEHAGISMAGGTPSQEGRNKFLAALANQTDAGPRATGDKNNNVITETTFNMLTGTNGAEAQGDVAWHSTAGMGAVPKNKGVADITTLSDLIMDKNIGGVSIDWLQIYKNALNIDNSTTEIEQSIDLQSYTSAIANAKLKYINSGKSSDYVIAKENEAKGAYSFKENAKSFYDAFTTNGSDAGKIMNKFMELEKTIANATTDAARNQYKNELELLKAGCDKDGKLISNNEESSFEYPLYWAVYEMAKAEFKDKSTKITWNTKNDSEGGAFDASSVSIKQLFYTENNGDIGGGGSSGNKGIQLSSIEGITPLQDYLNILTLCVNNTMVKDANTIKSLTISDLLKSDVVIMAQDHDSDSELNTIALAGKSILKFVASVFGYGHIGTGLNIDTTSDQALELALAMTEKKFLNTRAAVPVIGDEDGLKNNGAYEASQMYNRIGISENKEYAALNLSNMVSAFLTYYDNFLRGSESYYVVGKGLDDGKTSFVTDDPSYSYVTDTQDEITNDEKIADFYNQLYNNICAHGWRYDDMVQDSKYLESAVKDGRYQMMALNNDGYFYQMRYNEIGYLEEVQDTDAIARAEADYKTQKAIITYKEDEIDVKTKKLDAEITELNTEINSVQNIISKSIEKTFTMFSN